MNPEDIINEDGSIDLATLWDVTKQDLDDLDSKNPDPVQTGELANDFAQVLAKAVYGGWATDAEADPLMKQFARNASMKKSAVEEQFSAAKQTLKKKEERETAENDDDEPLSETITFLLKYRLNELVIYEPSDESVKMRYNWKFSTGVEVETGTEHLGPNSFAQCYHDASGGRLNATVPNLEGSWPEYIRDYVTTLRDEGEKVRVVPVEGLRTQAVEDLKDAIETKPATTDLRAAAQQYRAYIESTDADVVQVPSGLVERVLSDYEDTSYNDLQIELDKRGHRAGNVRATQVGRGTNVRFWLLNREWLNIEVEEPENDEDGTMEDDEE